MIDRENIKKGLEHCLTLDSSCEDCPYYSHEDIQELDCVRNLRQNALTLLKEQEPIAPSLCGSKEPDWHGSWRYLCGKCKKPIDNKDRFCKRCGQAVKWDA